MLPEILCAEQLPVTNVSTLQSQTEFHTKWTWKNKELSLQQESTLASQTPHTWWKVSSITSLVMIHRQKSWETNLCSRSFPWWTQMVSLMVIIDVVWLVVISIDDGSFQARFFTQLSTTQRNSSWAWLKRENWHFTVICMVTLDARISSCMEMLWPTNQKDQESSHFWCPKLDSHTSLTTTPDLTIAVLKSTLQESPSGESLAPKTPTYSRWNLHSAAQSQLNSNPIEETKELQMLSRWITTSTRRTFVMLVSIFAKLSWFTEKKRIQPWVFKILSIRCSNTISRRKPSLNKRISWDNSKLLSSKEKCKISRIVSRAHRTTSGARM